MNGLEFREIRRRLKLSKDEFARQLGYRGTRRNNYALMCRYENGSKQIPLTVASLAWLIEQWVVLNRKSFSAQRVHIDDLLPDWPDWPGYENPIGPPIDLDRAERPSAPRANHFMCQWGNCQSEKVAVSVNYAAGQTRPRFCCTEHGAAWLIRQARLLHPQGSFEEITLGAVERTIASVASPIGGTGEGIKHDEHQ